MADVQGTIQFWSDQAIDFSGSAETALLKAASAASTFRGINEVVVPDVSDWPDPAAIDTIVPRFKDEVDEFTDLSAERPNKFDVDSKFKDVIDVVKPEMPPVYEPDYKGIPSMEAPNLDNINDFNEKPDKVDLNGLFKYTRPSDYVGSFKEPFPILDLSIPDTPKPDGTVPEFNESVDEINSDGLFLQPAPSFDVDQFIKEPPPIDMDAIRGLFDGIIYPTITDHDAPSITDINIKGAPDVNLPEYKPTFTIPVIQDPENYAAEYKAMYDNSVLEMREFINETLDRWIATYAPALKDSIATLEAVIATDIEGGHALTEQFEQDLYNRARTKIEGERARNERELLQGMAKRGFTLPAGAVSAGLQNLHQAASDAIGQQATEIAIERSKMELQHKQFVMQLSQTVQQSLLNLAMQHAQLMGSINSQALEHAKTYTAQLAQIYEHILERAKVFTDIAKLEVLVFETQTKSAMAQIDLYKVEIEAEMAKVEIDKARVQLFEAQVRAESEKVNRYVAQIEAVVKRAEFERLQLDLFKAEVEAYVTRLQAKEIEYQIYKAALEGDKMKLEAETVKLDVFEKKLRAYEIQLGAKELEQKIYTASLAGDKLKLEAEMSKIEAFGKQVEAFNLTLKTKELEHNLYKLSLEGDKIKVEGEMAKLKAFSTKLDIYKTEMQTWELRARIYQAAMEGDKMKLEVEKARLEAYMSEVEAKKVEVSVDDLIAKSQLSYNNQLMEKYRLETQAYQTQVQAEATRYSADSDGYKALIEAFLKKNEVLLQDTQSQLEVEKEKAANYRFNYEAKNKFAIERVKVAVSEDQFRASTLSSVGNIYGSMAAAALSGQNSMVSLATTVSE